MLQTIEPKKIERKPKDVTLPDRAYEPNKQIGSSGAKQATSSPNLNFNIHKKVKRPPIETGSMNLMGALHVNKITTLNERKS